MLGKATFARFYLQSFRLAYQIWITVVWGFDYEQNIAVDADQAELMIIAAHDIRYHWQTFKPIQ